MIRNLEHADTLVKLALAAGVLLCYGSGVIAGPLAHGLLVLAIAVITLAIIRGWRKRHKVDH